MPTRDQDVIVVDPKPISRTESVFLPEVFKGLGTTLKHVLHSIGKGKAAKAVGAASYNKTLEYPEERRENMPVEEGGLYKPYYRGVHRLNRDEEGRVRCVACFMCQTACPAHCIHLEGAAAPWDDREKYPAKFDLDELRCIYCGMCEQACPCDAIELTTLFDLTGLSREEMMFDKEKLLSVFDQTVAAGTDPVRTTSGRLSIASEPKV